VTRRQGDEVLIVGAGPTGLTLAHALLAHGCVPRIVDLKAGPTHDSKALAINLASQYSFRLLGLTRKVGTSAAPIRSLAVFWRSRRLTRLDLGRLGVEPGHFLAQPQADTERELVAALAERGCEVQWKTRVLRCRSQPDGAHALIESGGSTREAQFSYIVGCDGPRSLVRRTIEADFSGRDYGMHFVLGDFVLAWDGRDDQAHYFVDEDGFIIVAPVGHGRWRVVVKVDGPLPPGDPDEGAIERGLARHLPTARAVGRPVWLSHAPFYQRTADRLYRGRLLVAGDAAHLFSPIGGAGMNTGIQDAMNLGWKLALCVERRGSSALLESYASERLEAIRSTAAVTDESTRLICRLERTVPRCLLPLPESRDFLRWSGPLRHSGLGQTCAGGFVLPSPVEDGGVRAGGFYLPMVRLLSLVAGAGGNRGIIVLAELSGAQSSWRPHAEGLEGLRRRFSPLVILVFLVAPLELPAAQQGCTGASLVPVDDGVRTDLGVRPGCLLVIRPDGILAFTGSLGEVDAVSALLSRYLRPSPSDQEYLDGSRCPTVSRW
jgi:2-polyprenyl-6-methoxyphenol hydroxylase-like FAD-dependent oxidoreductase